MIESYSFGKISIVGRTYTKDVILLATGTVISPWWRKSGHELTLVDISVILETGPKLLVVGTGNPGLMQPASGLEETLQEQGCRLIVEPTTQAVGTFNELYENAKEVAACFHLTC